MKFKLNVSNGSSDWWEEYDNDDVVDVKAAAMFGKQLVANFNETRRPKEKSRKFIAAEIVGPSEFTTCGDCGARYKAGAAHAMFCEARTCTECCTSFSYVLEEDSEGRRLCEDCEFGDGDEA